jgi:acetyl esterase/lipase
MWTGYQAEELKNPLASPVYGDFTHGIPKISMSIGTRELLYYDQLRFWEKLKEQSQGKSCGHLIIGKDMVHVYGILGDMPETVEPWQDIAAAVERLVQQS